MATTNYTYSNDYTYDNYIKDYYQQVATISEKVIQESKFEVGDLVLISPNINIPTIEGDWKNKFVTIEHKDFARLDEFSNKKEYLYSVIDYEKNRQAFWEDELMEA